MRNFILFIGLFIGIKEGINYFGFDVIYAWLSLTSVVLIDLMDNFYKNKIKQYER